MGGAGAYPAKHHNLIHLHAVVEKRARNSAYLNKTFALVETTCRGIFCIDRQFDLPDPVGDGMVRYLLQKFTSNACSALAGAHVNHDKGCPVRHLAWLLPHQPHDRDRFIVLKGDEDRRFNQPATPFIKRQYLPIFRAAGECGGVGTQSLKPNLFENLAIFRLQQFDNSVRHVAVLELRDGLAQFL